MTTTSRKLLDNGSTERRQRRTYNGGGLYRRNRWYACFITYSSVLVAIITIINNQHPGTAAERFSIGVRMKRWLLEVNSTVVSGVH